MTPASPLMFMEAGETRKAAERKTGIAGYSGIEHSPVTWSRTSLIHRWGPRHPKQVVPSKGRKRHACMGVHWPDALTSSFVHFNRGVNMRFKQEMHNPRPVGRVPSWACSSSIRSFFRHRGWWQWGGDFSNRTQASRYRLHALALSTLKTPSLTHQCRSIGKLNVLTTGFNKCKNRTAKHRFTIADVYRKSDTD